MSEYPPLFQRLTLKSSNCAVIEEALRRMGIDFVITKHWDSCRRVRAFKATDDGISSSTVHSTYCGCLSLLVSAILHYVLFAWALMHGTRCALIRVGSIRGGTFSKGPFDI
jgi:hypothetical protein